MLRDAIEARKDGKEIEDITPFEPEISLKIDAYIPEDYIKDEKQKIDIYKMFQTIESENDIIELQDELIDRFGDYPEEIENLFTVSKLRLYGRKERIEAITEKPKKLEMLIEGSRSQDIDGAKLFELANNYGRQIQLGTENTKLKVVITWTNETKHNRFEMTEDFIKKLEAVDRIA